MIRNNLGSLRMVMMLGQAGKDAGANLVNYLGGSVQARRGVGTGEQLQVPLFRMVRAGGNNEFAVALTAKGEDVAELLRRDDAKRGELLAHLRECLKEAVDKLEEAGKSGNGSRDRALKKAQDSVDVWNARIAAAGNGFDYGDADRDTQENVSIYDAQPTRTATTASSPPRPLPARAGSICTA